MQPSNHSTTLSICSLKKPKPVLQKTAVADADQAETYQGMQIDRAEWDLGTPIRLIFMGIITIS